MPARKNPLSAVGSQKKRATASATKQKKTSRAATRASRSAPKQPVRPMAVWQRNLLAVLIVGCFFTFFYYFFVRPYAYRWRPCRGLQEYGVCIPARYAIHGIDISHHQGPIDWGLLRQSRLSATAPLHFVFMKATEGGDFRDSTFAVNFSLAREQGFIRGAYHFYNPATDARKQAEFFIRTVQLLPGDLPPVLDVEVVGRRNKQELQRELRLWLECVEAHYGVKPVLYTSYKFKLRYLDDPFFEAYPYWIAHYYVEAVRYSGPWAFWQHTDRGRVPGIGQPVDLNVFNGTWEELMALTIRP